MDTERFDAIKDRITHEKRARAGIGTYRKKRSLRSRQEILTRCGTS